jgi:hypothetical protein
VFYKILLFFPDKTPGGHFTGTLPRKPRPLGGEHHIIIIGLFHVKISIYLGQKT